MRWFILSVLLASSLSALRGDEPLRSCVAPKAWLGLEVSKPEESIHAQLTNLPKGIGFVVRAIDAEGPAAAAGIRTLDIIWKLEDQMLVNEGQLAALLRLREPGETITLSGFRGGLPMNFSIRLGNLPECAASRSNENIIENSLLQSDFGGPMRVINVREKIATYSDAEGTAEVRNRNGIYQVRISSPSNVVIHDGNLTPDGRLESVPPAWRRKIDALRRGLQHAVESGATSTPRPRARVIVPTGN